MTMKIGLVGYGFMGGAHLAALQSIAGVEVVAVASRTRPSADAPVRGNLDLKAGPLPESVHWTPDWRDVVNDASIDAIDVCLPTPMHREVIEAAFAKGKHVLCEKPMALTVSDCDALLEIAERSERTFMVAQVLRFMHPYVYARDFVQRHGTDAITACVLRRSTGFPHWSNWLREESVSGGAILDLLSHDLDQVLDWFGLPDAVSATSLGPVDTARAVLRYSRVDVIVEGGWLEPETEFAAGFEIKTETDALLFAADTLAENGQTVTLPADDPYRKEIDYFIDCCRTGAKPERCMPRDSANAVRVAALVKQARETGREVLWQ